MVRPEIFVCAVVSLGEQVLWDQTTPEIFFVVVSSPVIFLDRLHKSVVCDRGDNANLVGATCFFGTFHRLGSRIIHVPRRYGPLKVGAFWVKHSLAQSYPSITPTGKLINNSSEENDHTQKIQLVYYNMLCKIVSNLLYTKNCYVSKFQPRCMR